MLHDPGDLILFPRLSGEALEYLAKQGTELQLNAGDLLFTEGDESYHFYVVLEGEVKITKQIDGQETVLAIHQPGEFTGEISMITGRRTMASARSVGTSRVLCIDADKFKTLVGYAPLAEVVIPAMAARAQEAEAQMRQMEKLAALGKLSAGLAHELNNPAAAALSATRLLCDQIQTMQSNSLAHDERFSSAQRETLMHLLGDINARVTVQPSADPLEQFDLEEQLATWLKQHGVSNVWRLAPLLTSAGLTQERLEMLDTDLNADILMPSLQFLEGILTTSGLVNEIEQSTRRISELVAAMKQYSYRDTTNRQEVDVHDGIESTLTILGHKLKKGVTVIREYDRSLPRICVYGSELNQVWSNIIDNAVDAMHGKGHLWIRTSREADYLIVEIADDGPGIPAVVLNRIWEPFFTTKGVGEGTGLGLDITRRIVTRQHGGQIRVTSSPGDTTRFQVRLPINQTL